MYKIKIIGFKDQGVKTAAQILSTAAFLSGKQTQNFVLEDKDQVKAYIWISPAKISEHGEFENADTTLVFDKALASGKNEIVNKGFATEIALKLLKKPIPNTAMLGAFAAKSQILSFRDVVVGIEKVIGRKVKQLENANIMAAKQGFDRMVKE